MRLSRPTLFSLGLILLAFILTAAVYSRLPEYVPTHWNAAGVADGKMAKPWGPFMLPLTMVGIFALLIALPYISPRHYEIEPFRQAYEAIQAAILGFMFAMNALVLLAGIGWAVPMSRLIPVALGVLLVLVGNFMGKVTTNFFVGIRTPWTLADPEVWLRTHRLAGKVFTLAGSAIVVAGLLGAATRVLVYAALLAVVVPAIYSYFAYLSLERARGHR